MSRAAVRRVLAGAVAAVLVLAGVTIAVAPSDPTPAPVAAADGARDVLTGAVDGAREAVDRAVEAAEPGWVPPSLYIVEVTGAFEDDDTDGVEAILVLEDPTGRIDYVPTRLPYRAALAPGTVVTGHESTGTGAYLRCALRLGGEVVSTDVGGGPANETFACLGQR